MNLTSETRKLRNLIFVVGRSSMELTTTPDKRDYYEVEYSKHVYRTLFGHFLYKKEVKTNDLAAVLNLLLILCAL